MTSLNINKVQNVVRKKHLNSEKKHATHIITFITWNQIDNPFIIDELWYLMKIPPDFKKHAGFINASQR